MPYEVHEGRVLTWSLEVHLVDECNLACAECCTLSPELPARAADPEEIARDLSRAATALAPSLLKLTGGEPLLHPRLAECLRAARASGIARELSVTTNGILIRKAPPELWELADRLTVSWYPSAPLPESTLDWIEGRCREADVHLNLKRATTFQRMTPERPVEDEALARAVFDGCWMKHRCHLLHAGRFYRCTRPPHLDTRLARLGILARLSEVDGVALEGPGLLGRLVAYLDSEVPLSSCRSCLGNTGPHEPHRQLGTARA